MSYLQRHDENRGVYPRGVEEQSPTFLKMGVDRSVISTNFFCAWIVRYLREKLSVLRYVGCGRGGFSHP